MKMMRDGKLLHQITIMIINMGLVIKTKRRMNEFKLI